MRPGRAAGRLREIKEGSERPRPFTRVLPGRRASQQLLGDLREYPASKSVSEVGEVEEVRNGDQGDSEREARGGVGPAE